MTLSAQPLAADLGLRPTHLTVSGDVVASSSFQVSGGWTNLGVQTQTPLGLGDHMLGSLCRIGSLARHAPG
eukprot:3484466-Pyramimonas_sp.AAC.1